MAADGVLRRRLRSTGTDFHRLSVRLARRRATVQHDGMSGASQDHSVQSQVEAAQTQARIRAEAGDLPGARTLLEQALKTGEHQLGRDHPRLASVMIDLATVAGELGNITEAQRQLRLAYGIVVTSAGPEHHSALLVEARLALATHRLGEPTDAYDRHLVDAGTRVLGADHPAVLDAQDRLASGSGSGFPEPIYIPSPHAPGVFDRQASTDERFANVDDHIPASPQPNIQLWGEPPVPQPDIDVWPEPPPAADRPRAVRSGGLTVIASLGVAVVAAAAVVAFQILSPDPGAGGGPGATPVGAGESITADAQPNAGAAATPPVATPTLTPAMRRLRPARVARPRPGQADRPRWIRHPRMAGSGGRPSTVHRGRRAPGDSIKSTPDSAGRPDHGHDLRTQRRV